MDRPKYIIKRVPTRACGWDYIPCVLACNGFKGLAGYAEVTFWVTYDSSPEENYQTSRRFSSLSQAQTFIEFEEAADLWCEAETSYFTAFGETLKEGEIQ